MKTKKRNYVCFLFINGPHHVYHLIEPALTFSSKVHGFETLLISGNPINTKIIRNAHKMHSKAKFKLIDIALPLRYSLMKNYKNKVYPPIYTRIDKILRELENSVAIISTSHDLPNYLIKRKINGPMLFYLYHGTGTRAYGFEKNLSLFDHILIPGSYHKKRFLKEKICNDKKLTIVGQPKFDWIAKNYNYTNQLFDNDNPTFYYNPHWELGLSSYFKWQRFILDFFMVNKQWNLIFAPHPLVKHMSSREKYNIDLDKYNSQSIIVDHESEKLVDGTYNILSDVYIGDVSSMVTEFLNLKRRPCIFINAHEINWEEQESYHIWNYGEVVDDNRTFTLAVKNSLKKNRFQEKQKKYLQDFIHREKKTSSTLCTDHIIKELNFVNEL